jgi:hypothetical protein
VSAIRVMTWLLTLVVAGSVGAATRSLAPAVGRSGVVPGPGCEDGLVLDDGSFETAYGWVPSAQWGEYVQTFRLGAANPVLLESVCVCWTRTLDDDSLAFEVEVYEDVDGEPAEAPVVVVGASMVDVPLWPDGGFTEIPLGADVPALAPGTYHVGVRWGPSTDRFFFVCADQSDPDAAVGGFFRDDRADGWGSVLETTDPIFADHTAMLIRVRDRDVVATPATSRLGAGILVLLVALAAWWRLIPGSPGP